MPIPDCLKEIAVPVSEKGEWTTFSLKCSCGCDAFYLSENRLTKEEQMLERPYYDALDYLFGSRGSGFGSTGRWIDDQGRAHSWRLLSSQGLDGPKEDVIIPDRPFFSGIIRLTVKCADCGTEHILFDSRFHGYDGMIRTPTPEELAYQPHMKQRRGGPIAIQVKVETTETPGSILEIDRTDLSPTDWTNAFDWIIVYKIKDGKRTKIFEMETA